MCGLFSKLTKSPQELYELGNKARDGGDFFLAKEYYEKADKKGHVRSSAVLALMYAKGDGGPQDYSKTVEYSRKAAEKEDCVGEYILALCYRDGQGIKENQNEFLKYLKRSAEHGFGEGQYLLGTLYENGYPNLSKSKKKAMEWYEKAAKQGHAKAQLAYGICLSELSETIKQAMEWYIKANENGSQFADAEIGILYYLGQGVETDYNKAIKLLAPAAESGYVRAMAVLGIMYYRGLGTVSDRFKGLQLLEAAASQNEPRAMIELAKIYGDPENPSYNRDKSLKYLEEVSAGGNAEGQYLLGITLLDNCPERLSEAVGLITQSAKAGYPDAEIKYGMLCSEGKGVIRDYGEAARFFERAGHHGLKEGFELLDGLYKQKKIKPQNDEENIRYLITQAKTGDANAQFSLGLAYASGKGVSQDYKEAVKWYRMSADGGNSAAMNNLAILYNSGKGVQKNDDEAIRLYKMAIEKGYTLSKSNLAYLYYNLGRYTEAAELFDSCYRQGNAKCAETLGRLYKSGKGVGKDIRKAVELYTFAAKHGIVPAAVSLALIYSEEQYGCLDQSEAAKWYQVGASNGNVLSMRELGLMYLEGRGVGTDISKGIELLKKAADKDDNVACRKLASIYDEGKLVRKDQWQSNKYLEKLANKGDVISAYGLALNLDIDAKTDADNLKAMKWYAVASDGGIPYATKTLARYYLLGVGGKRNLKEASKYYLRSKYSKVDPMFRGADREFSTEDVELLELAVYLCTIKEKYPGCKFFVRRSRIYQETKTERVKVGENVEKLYIDGVYAYDVNSTPIYEDREWTESYEGVEDSTYAFDDLIDAARIMSEKYSSDGYAVIGFSTGGGDYRAATFRDGNLI